MQWVMSLLQNKPQQNLNQLAVLDSTVCRFVEYLKLTKHKTAAI